MFKCLAAGMRKKGVWSCQRIIRKCHGIEKEEFEQRLAELWEVLINRKSQFPRFQDLVSIKSHEPLFTKAKGSK